MASEKKFTIGGTSIHKGKTTWRFATGKLNVRVGVLKRGEHTAIKLQELPQPMTKADIIAYLEKQGMKASMPAGRKGTGKPKAAKPKVAKKKAASKKAAAPKTKAPMTQEQKDAKNAAARLRRSKAKNGPDASGTGNGNVLKEIEGDKKEEVATE